MNTVWYLLYGRGCIVFAARISPERSIRRSFRFFIRTFRNLEKREKAIMSAIMESLDAVLYPIVANINTYLS
ncbi:MAG: hypothetical protein UEE32_02790, partial [Oscillospiraceae bacterium]|nr:hypothetical protein [Oscillospiraceae bacterium]